MGWDEWVKNTRFTLFKSSIIQEQFINHIQANTKTGGKIFEAGFGQGVTMVLLDDLGYDVCGIDNDKIVVDFAKERFGLLSERFKIGDILNADDYDNVDVINHQGVLEHFADEEITEILSIQEQCANKIIFDVPNNMRSDLSDEGDNTRYESVEFWEDIVSTAGLKFTRYGRNYDTEPQSIPKNLQNYDSELMRKIGRSCMFVCESKR